ncbi:MAG: SMC-Scp complex subunit ScpB [Candidatus Thiodiazotropha sp.]|jgi:segregation and condensation protein B
MSDDKKLKQIIEAALLAAGRPLSLDQFRALFNEQEQPDKTLLRDALSELTEDYQGRGVEVIEVGNGFRIQVRSEFSRWVSKLWAERPPKYSRALLETLALVAYRQPITRGEIEEIRGVSVSTNIIRTLTEREWVRVVGHRDVPGKPSLYATTKEFLDYFNLKSLNELPTLAEIRDLDSINQELELLDPNVATDEPDANGGKVPDSVSEDAESDLVDNTISIEDNAEVETIHKALSDISDEIPDNQDTAELTRKSEINESE